MRNSTLRPASRYRARVERSAVGGQLRVFLTFERLHRSGPRCPCQRTKESHVTSRRISPGDVDLLCRDEGQTRRSTKLKRVVQLFSRARRIPAATRSSSAMTILDAAKFAPSKNGGDRDGAKSGAKIGAAATTSAKCDCDLGNLRARSFIVPRFQSHATTTR